MTTIHPAAETLALDEKLCLALYNASKAMTARYRESLVALGLTYPQYLVMTLLWENGTTAVGQIGARLHLESSTLSPLVKRLETMGLVNRSRDSRDERSVLVGLTRSGRSLRRRSVGVASRICDATGMTMSDQVALAQQLRALTEALVGPA